MKEWQKKYDKAERIFCALCLGLCTLTLFVNAISRQCGYSFRFANDLALALFTYLTFIGADLAYRNNKLARVDFLVTKLPKKGQDIMEYVNLFFCLLLFVLIGYLGIQLVIKSWKRPIPSLPNISYGYILSSVPFGAILMIFSTFMKLSWLIRDKKNKKGCEA